MCFLSLYSLDLYAFSYAGFCDEFFDPVEVFFAGLYLDRGLIIELVKCALFNLCDAVGFEKDFLRLPPS